MSYTSSFGYTNSTASQHPVTPKNIKVTTNYALKADEPTEVVLDNKTCPLDKPEALSFMCTDLKKVSTRNEIQHPTANTSGVQYVVKLDEVLSTTSDTDAGYRTDEPVVMYLTVRHQKSGNVTAALLADVFCRLIGALQKEDGTWRFDELMRSALKPTVN